MARLGEPAHSAGMSESAISDRQVYELLANAADELHALAQRAESFVGNAALQTAATTLAGAAKAVYEHCMDESTH